VGVNGAFFLLGVVVVAGTFFAGGIVALVGFIVGRVVL